MNERIRELAEQAKIDYELLPEIAREPVWIAIDDELEKFAQLIVAECVKLCEHKSNDDEYDQYDMGQSVKAENIKTSIKKHFGVEE